MMYEGKCPFFKVIDEFLSRYIPEDKAKGDKAWKIRCTNPDTSNGYSFVDAWVSQRSGALVRMNGYNAKSQIVKNFEVDSVQSSRTE